MDFMSICRTCMSGSLLNPIFPLPEVHERFSKAIYLVTGLKVTINDGLPQKMCIDCLKQVNDAMKFRAKCKETEESLLKIKTEIRRAVRHNKSIVNYRNDFIREIKVENRWFKIDQSSNVPLVDNDDNDNDEQPLMHLLNTQTSNNIQNIYITNETDGQMIPLEMLKVEIGPTQVDALNQAEDSIYNSEGNVNESDCTVDNLQDTVNEQGDSVTASDDNVHNTEYTVSDAEYNENNPADTVNDAEYIINNSEEVVNEPEYTIINIEGNVQNPEDSIIESEDVINDQEDAVNDQEDAFNDPEVSDSLKTYYIFKDNVICSDTVKMIKSETDTIDDSEYDNINISENQEIVVMDNRESLYVIDMSNPSSKRVTCKLCQKNLSIRSIDLHLSKSHPGADGRRIKCQLCDNFVIREKMVQHRLVMHGAEAFQCRYCKWEFEKEDALIEHVVTCTAKKKRKVCETGRELVECDVCHKTMQKASLRLHTATAHAGLRPVCDHCGKCFGNKFRLSEHCRAKHGYEKFKCSYCDFRSASSLALRNHERRHRGEKPYVCERCGAKFHAAYLLAQHRHTHRTERKFKCETCAVWFKTNNGLHSHRRTCHGGERRLRSGRARDDQIDAPSEINDV